MSGNPVVNINLSHLRRAKVLRSGGLVRTETLVAGGGLPLLVTPNVKDLDPISWASSQRSWLESLLLQHGGLLFRNFDISGLAGFQKFVAEIWGEPLEYHEQTSPRHRVHGNIYTSTDHPPDQRIFLHNENSYSNTWPLKIMFFCLTPPRDAGETPIADVRRVLARMPETIRERFARLGWMLVRNFRPGYGVSWQKAFQTTDPAEVNRYCLAADIQYEWLSPERLRIRQRRPALATHPVTREEVWFNHATFFHISTLDAQTQAGLLAEMAEEDLPYNTYYGDGSSIEPEVLDSLRHAYEQETVSFPWRENDLLLLDNMLSAHGRSPFQGPRKIVVAMAEPQFRTEGMSI